MECNDRSFPCLNASQTLCHVSHHTLIGKMNTAIFILHDPVEWAEEIQVLCDLVEGGVLATHAEHANRKQVGSCYVPMINRGCMLHLSAVCCADPKD